MISKGLMKHNNQKDNSNSVDANFSGNVDSYFVNRDLDEGFFCPNVSLFRFIGSAFGSLAEKNVLEVGFGRGADLMECKRRGANVFGLDLNPKSVEYIISESSGDFRNFRAGTDQIPFKQKFDLIYSRDTIYYLTDGELKQFFVQCRNSLLDDGNLIVQFIETDLKLKVETKQKPTNKFDLNYFINNFSPTKIFPEENPIRFLCADSITTIAKDCDLLLKGSKIMLQSYDLQEREIRVDKYLLFSRV
jgi:2-polyprenyl-3-methyl-5-hydroxy-6-metoxy-1,4-benzoquinol methylase